MTKKSSKSAVWGLSQTGSLKDRIVASIVDRIVNGSLPVGARLPPEASLCSEMGVSRVALREAVKQLEVLGFLRIARGNGTLVTQPDLSSAEPVIEFLGKTGKISFADLHALRTLVEIEAVGLLAAVRTDSLCDALDKIVEDGVAHIRDSYGHVTLDYEFHQLLLDACPNPLLAMVLSPFSKYLRKSRELSFSSITKARRAFEAHADIAGAIRSRDSPRARKLMSAHLSETAHDLKSITV